MASVRSYARRIPGARGLVYRLSSFWARRQPFPLPEYTSNAPGAGPGSGGGFDVPLPPTAATLGEASMSEEAARGVMRVLDRLTKSDEVRGGQVFYSVGQAKYGRYWRHADLLRMLWAASTFLKPQTYLEIGVRRGRSAAVVGAYAPECAIYGFDVWLEDYAGEANPGPEFVREELRKSGHAGPVELVSGDSRITVPRFLREHPDLYFDLITIDGDKSLAGCASDFAHALPRLKVGGAVMFDDMPRAPHLRRIWQRVIESDWRYARWEFNDGRIGIAVAVRVGE